MNCVAEAKSNNYNLVFPDSLLLQTRVLLLQFFFLYFKCFVYLISALKEHSSVI